jgi:hypothetical protein
LQSAFNRAKLEVDEYYAALLDDVRAEHMARCDELHKEIEDLTELVESYVQVCAAQASLEMGGRGWCAEGSVQ